MADRLIPKVLLGVNLVASVGLAICGGVLLKRDADRKLLSASFGISIALILCLLIHGLLTSSFGKGGLLLLFLYLIVLYPVVILSVVLYAKNVKDSVKIKLVNSLKAMLFVSSGAGVLLLLYQQHLGGESTKANADSSSR